MPKFQWSHGHRQTLAWNIFATPLTERFILDNFPQDKNTEHFIPNFFNLKYYFKKILKEI